MLEAIEKLLILQDRDRKIRRLQAELANIEPERQTLKINFVTAQAQLESRETTPQADRIRPQTTGA